MTCHHGTQEDREDAAEKRHLPHIDQGADGQDSRGAPGRLPSPEPSVTLVAIQFWPMLENAPTGQTDMTLWAMQARTSHITLRTTQFSCEVRHTYLGQINEYAKVLNKERDVHWDNTTLKKKMMLLLHYCRCCLRAYSPSPLEYVHIHPSY